MSKSRCEPILRILSNRIHRTYLRNQQYTISLPNRKYWEISCPMEKSSIRWIQEEQIVRSGGIEVIISLSRFAVRYYNAV